MLAGARIDGLSVEAAVVAAGGGADLQRHADAFAPVVVAAARDRADELALRAEIAAQHLGIALEAAGGQHDRACPEARGPIVGAGGLDAVRPALVVLDEPPRRRLVVNRDPVRDGFGMRRQRLHQGEAASRRCHARRALGDEVVGQKVKRDPEAGEPAQRRPGIVGERRDQLGIDESKAAQEPRPFVVGFHALLDHRRVEVAAGVLGEAVPKILGDRVVALHPPEGFGVPGVTAALLLRRSLQQRDPGAGLLGADGRREAGDAAAHHDHVVAVVSASHVLVSPADCGLAPGYLTCAPTDGNAGAGW